MAIKKQRTPKDLSNKLLEQLNFLETSAELYDRGNEKEAIRMAVTLRILLHDSKNSKSLLSQLGKKSIQFYDTVWKREMFNINVPYCGLISVHMEQKKTHYVATLDDVPEIRRIDRDHWWNMIIFEDKDGNSISRKTLILTMADKDGGAHVDPAVNEEYLHLSTGESLTRKYSVDGKIWFDVQGAALASVRQIAHEVLKTVVPNYQKKPKLSKGITIGGIQIVDGKTSTKSTTKLVNTDKKVGRNDPCPCGSGKKYKKCCGAKY